MIDGTGNFLIVDNNGMPLYNSKWSSVLKNIITKYNKTHDVELPKITPHTFRHQFATKCSDCGMSINATQFIIGHSDVSTLLNIYTHSTIENVQREFLAKMG